MLGILSALPRYLLDICPESSTPEFALPEFPVTPLPKLAPNRLRSTKVSLDEKKNMTSLFMTVTPSLNGFFIGLIAGAVVIGAAIGGLAVISQLDKVQRS